MGNCESFQLSYDQMLNQICRRLYGKGYIRNLKKNLKALQREMVDLVAIEHDVQNKIAKEEKQHRIRLEIVQVWLTRVESINRQVNNLLRTRHDHLNKLCLCGLCSKNIYWSHNYGKSVFFLLEEVKKLKSEGNFEMVTELTPRSEVEEMPTRPIVVHETMLEKAWNHIMEDEVGIMGLHGMGGVGKTTLFNKIHNKFTEMVSRFDVEIWVVVSQSADISKLQEDIAKKLHLYGEKWRDKPESDKALEINKFLKGKRFVLMLDDIWEKVDLESIGVPFPTIENKCKVAFTTRFQEVCERMGDHEPMQVNCLNQDEAWELFKNKVGESTLRKDLVILKLAKEVAVKCRGLPLALSVIGETMATKTTIQEWEHAIDVLTRSAAEFNDIENKILPILKFSYDSLKEETIKSCFLYCALFPEDENIDSELLIDYWICEGFLGECQDIKEAKNKGYEVLGTLIRANLLIEVNTISISTVKMHDVVREMALWIASNFGNHKENFVIQARLGLLEQPKVKELGALRRLSLMHNKIEEITFSSKFPELRTLFLQNNNLKNLSGEFIQSMKKLVVLDLSGNCDFDTLPEQISEMACLQYLDLSNTNIVNLPKGFLELKKLTQLNLNGTKRLHSISGISKLSSLKILELLNSNVHGDASLVNELQLLEHLQVLTITISTELGLDLISSNQKLAKCIDYLEICNFQQKPINVSLIAKLENLRYLAVQNCHIVEISTDTKHGESRIDLVMIPCFTNLSHVVIHGCNNTKDLTWLLFAPKLVFLHIANSNEMEEIINKEITTNLTPLWKLEVLSLFGLPKLESIYWSPLPFPFLRHIHAIYCPKLSKLPLNATSVPRVEELSITIDPREQLEWEDKDTKNRFLPSFNQMTRL